MTRFLLASTMAILAFLAAGEVSAGIVHDAVRENSGSEQDFQRAKASSRDANEAFAAGNVQQALAHAEAAYRFYPNTSTAMLMATIYAQSKNSKRAFRWFLRARNHRPPESYVQRLNEALLLHGAEAKLSIVRIVTTPERAKVRIAGMNVAPGSFVGASYGSHAVSVELDGYEPMGRTIEVKPGSFQTIELSLVKVSTPEPPTDSAGVPGLPLGLLIGGIVVAGAGAGLHVWGLSGASELEDMNGAWGTESAGVDEARSRYDALRDRSTTGSTVAYVLYGVGAAAIITGAVLWGLDGPADSGTADVVVAPFGSPTSAGLTLQGDF